MKSNKRSSSPRAKAATRLEATAAPGPRTWHYLLGLVAVLLLAFEIYQPAIRGPFLFDDRYLPFFTPGWADAPLRAWLAGVRPLLMFSYWVNFQLSQTDPYGYHLLNVTLHAANSVLIGLIVHRILAWANIAVATSPILGGFGGMLFLVHPIHTESVAYVASRSETLSVLLFNAAFAVFVYRRSVAVSVRVAVAVLVLFLAACFTKEHAAVLPALLLLTDYFWNPGFSYAGIRRNWKLYVPIASGAVIAGLFVSRVLASATTAGFGMRDLAWYEYFFSQCRAMWVYLRMFVLPFGQNVDHDFAISRNLVEHGAVLGLAALIAVSVAAWMYRRRYPVASYGWFVFVILLAPTSSFVPIRDLLVERRLYLPFVGLILICCEFLAKWRTTRMRLAGTLAAVVAVYAVAAYHRNQLWGDAIALWSDTADKSPGKSRPRFQLGYAYYLEGQCAEAAAEYAKAAGIEKPRYDLYVDWALADDCANKPEAALEKLQRAAAIEKTAHVYALIGMVHAKQRRRDEAMAALDQAQQVDPNFQRTYLYRGNLYLLAKEFDKAEEQFRRAIALNPADIEARKGLDMALRRSPVRM